MLPNRVHTVTPSSSSVAVRFIRLYKLPKISHCLYTNFFIIPLLESFSYWFGLLFRFLLLIYKNIIASIFIFTYPETQV